jgi:hypothetical protein
MNNNNIKKEISGLLETISEQAEIIKNHQENIPQLYLDIIKENIRKLYENIHNLDKLNSKPDIIKPETGKIAETAIKEKIEKKEPIVEITPALSEKIKTEAKEEPAKTKPESIKDIQPEIVTSHEEKKEPKPEIVIDESTNEENNKTLEQSVAPIPKIKETTIDMFSDNTISIGEKLIDKQDKSIAAKMQKTQIIDLRTSIGINDKFLFINELFEGDMKNYNDAIDKLNSFNNLNEAIVSINLLRIEYKWKTNDEAFIKLNELIEGRYK